jgi:hypothetical protein
MLKKLPLIPERPLRVCTDISRVAKGEFLQALRGISGKAPFADLNNHFTLLSINHYLVGLEVP